MQSSGTAARKSIAPQKDGRLFTLKRNIPYLLMMLIPSALLLVFNYWPMIGLSMAFQNYRTGAPFLSASTQWVGMKWFETFLRNPMAGRLIRNTLLLNVYSILVSFPACIMLALTLNELRSRKLKKFATNVSMLPYFISTVVVCSMIHMFFNASTGVVNQIIRSLGGQPVEFLYSTSAFDHLYIWSGVWQGLGWGTIIYLANLSNVSPDLIEAARLDGASRMDIVIHVNIPTILPTIVIMLILRIGSIMGVGFEKVFLLQTQRNISVSRVISTYVYELTLGSGGSTTYWDTSTAIGLFNSIVNLLLIIMTNTIARRISEITLW